jgi:hypothetical protein
MDFFNVGQFWSVPVQITPFSDVPNETLRDVNSDEADYYVATVASTISPKPRSFSGRIINLTWQLEEGPCLYVGDVQAGPVREIDYPSKVNDGVIEGSYTQYRVSGPFDGDFTFGEFDQSICMGQ